MTVYEWSETREHAITKFGGETPRAQLEHEVLEHFLRNPTQVINAIDQVGAQYTAGKARSGWAVLRTHLNDQAQRANIVVDDQAERDRAISRAEQWIRAAGIHYDREDEVQDELFGDRGTLKQWPELTEHMLALWVELRPTGEQTEAEHIERMTAYAKHNTCPDCGTVNPFANRPCHCPQSRKRTLEELEAKTPDEWQAPAVDDSEPARDDERSRWFE